MELVCTELGRDNINRFPAQLPSPQSENRTQDGDNVSPCVESIYSGVFKRLYYIPPSSVSRPLSRSYYSPYILHHGAGYTRLFISVGRRSVGRKQLVAEMIFLLVLFPCHKGCPTQAAGSFFLLSIHFS